MNVPIRVPTLRLVGFTDQALLCLVSLADCTDFCEFKTPLEIHLCLI